MNCAQKNNGFSKSYFSRVKRKGADIIYVHYEYDGLPQILNFIKFGEISIS